MTTRMNQIGTGQVYLGEHTESTDGRVTIVLQHYEHGDSLVIDTTDIVVLRDRLNEIIVRHKLE